MSRSRAIDDSDPAHVILAAPWEYEIIGLAWQCGDDEPYLDLTLRRDGVVRRLRFLAPQDVRIDGPFNPRTGGLSIVDVRARGLEGIGVCVTDFEGSSGAIGFWARDVLDLDG